MFMRRLFVLCVLPFLLDPRTGGGLIGPLVAAVPASVDRIVLYDLSSGTQREITLGSGQHTVWGFTPDGCRVVATLSIPGGFSRMVSARLDGTDVRDLVQYTEFPPDRWGAWEPQVRPSGDRIAFTMLRDQPDETGTLKRTSHIAWIPLQGGEPVFYSVTGAEFSPRWSPDGVWLAYVSYSERLPGASFDATAAPTEPASPPLTPVREADLWVVRADAQIKYWLTNYETGSVSAPRWSPDSAYIAYVYSPGPNNDQYWRVANVDNAPLEQLTTRWSLALDHTWLPDSTALLASVRDFRDTSENRLWQIPPVENAQDAAALYLADPALSYADYPRFSPDGSQLVLRTAYALALVDVAAGSWAYLDENRLGNSPPVWSPIAFAGEAACP